MQFLLLVCILYLLLFIVYSSIDDGGGQIVSHENSNTNIVAGGGISPTVEFNSSSVKTPACDNYLLAEVHGDVMMRSQKVAYYKGKNAVI